MTARGTRWLAAAAVVCFLFAGSAATAGETDVQITHGWWHPVPQVEPWVTDASSFDATCSVSGRLWIKEVKTSGITRMRLSFHKYGAYSPSWKLLALQSTYEVGYPRSSENEFPDDDHEYYVHATLGWGVMTGDRGEQVVARFVGERPSLWNPDVVRDIPVGSLLCDPSQCISQEGINTCAQNVQTEGVTGGGGHVENSGEEDDDFYEDQPPPGHLIAIG